MIGLALPAQQVIRSARSITRILSRFRISDPLTKTILEILAVESGISISDITRKVREIRGKASRRVIASRIRYLESLGIVKTKRKGSAVKVYLVRDIEDDKESH